VIREDGFWVSTKQLTLVCKCIEEYDEWWFDHKSDEEKNHRI
jgi:hypothetical protein